MTFLENYALAHSGTEVPEIYHRWGALATMSACLSRRIWSDQGDWLIYPNLYVIFVGPAGGRKSTARNKSRKLLEKIGGIPISADSTTREAIMKDLVDMEPMHFGTTPYRHLAVYANEWKNFIDVNPQGMVTFLTNIWDNEDKFETRYKNQGIFVVENPCLTILGCMTPQHTSAMLKEDLISTGLSRRVIFPYFAGECEKYIWKTRRDPLQESAFSRCVQLGRHFKTKLHGQIRWTDAADIYGEDWYGNHMKSLEGSDPNGITRSWDFGLHAQVVKLSILFAVNSDPETPRVEIQHVSDAVSALREIGDALPQVFHGTGKNEQVDVITKVLSILKRGPVSKKRLRLMTQADCKGRDFEEVLLDMRQAGQVEMEEGKFKLKD